MPAASASRITAGSLGSRKTLRCASYRPWSSVVEVSYGQVWTKLVGGLGGAKSFRMRVAVGMSPSPAAISKARSRLGWQVMADLLERVAGPLAGRDDGWAHVAGLRLVAFDGLTVDVPDTAVNAAAFGRPGGGLGAGA